MILACITTALITAIVVALLVYRKMRHKVDYMLDALEDKELNFRFDERVLIGRGFNKTLNRLRTIFDKERHEISEQERYFGQMLDHVQTGILVVDDGKVNYCNKTALSLLGFATLVHIRQLTIISDSLFAAFINVSSVSEQRVSFYTERGERTLTLSATETKIHGNTVKIIVFNDISNQIAENEQLSWSRLIRVLTHEIMNTVTPIASLSETLSKDVSSPDMKSGLETISASSRELIKFVDSYRSLTRIATPNKKAFFLKELIDRVLSLVANQIEIAGVECVYTEKTDDILLYADEGQISQLFINLIRNAIQAEASRIDIVAQIDNSEAIVIDVINNGRAISRESQDQIFVPFFTTKQDGTGIGLSLSRQIMRLHNGFIRLVKSDEKQTVFMLLFR